MGVGKFGVVGRRGAAGGDFGGVAAALHPRGSLMPQHPKRLVRLCRSNFVSVMSSSGD